MRNFTATVKESRDFTQCFVLLELDCGRYVKLDVEGGYGAARVLAAVLDEVVTEARHGLRPSNYNRGEK